MKYTFVSVPALGDKHNTYLNIKGKLVEYAQAYKFDIPEFKIGTLDALVVLSDDLVKYDTVFEQSVHKLSDLFNSLIKGQEVNVQEQLLVTDKAIEEYVSTFKWNTMKYRINKSLQETTVTLSQEISAIDNIIKTKSNSYTQTKNALQTLQRKQTGNLSVRNLNGIVKKHHCVLNSEFLTTVFVAVPTSLYKQWNNKYETLCDMVVPRSSTKITEDEEFGLFSVTVFRKAMDEFCHKAREERFIPRDFSYDEDALQTQQRELEESISSEREQQAELIRLTKTNFGEVFSSWVHLKALRVFVESVLRYGLPPDFTSVSIQPKPKFEQKVDDILVAHYGGLGGIHGQAIKNENQEELLDHDLQSVNDSSYRPFVQFDLHFEYERR